MKGSPRTSGAVRTLGEVADALGLERSTVAIIEAQALAKMRRGLGLPQAVNPRWLQRYIDIALNSGRRRRRYR
jgi:Sigma-70, region 4